MGIDQADWLVDHEPVIAFGIGDDWRGAIVRPDTRIWQPGSG